MAVSTIALSQHKEGDKYLNIGLGVGGGYYYGSYTLPTLGLTYEKGIKDNLSVGLYLGYTRSTESYTYFTSTATYTYNYIIVGPRASYHYNLFDMEGLDTYGGILLGYAIVNVSVDDEFGTSDYTVGSGFFAYSFFIGARYKLNESLSLFGELGAGYSPITVGLTFKMKNQTP